ncbi:MAG: DUF2269 family protein [Candidatus Eisenbacteria bacterium]
MSPTAYSIMKLVHLAAVALFLGNVVLGIFWKAHADRSKDPRIIAHTLEGIIRSDRMFTMPAILVLLIGGFGAQGMGGYPIRLPWIFWSIILLSFSGAVFMGSVVPTQKKMLSLARSASFDWAGYQKLSAQWNRFSFVATLTLWIAFGLMVLKPH